MISSYSGELSLAERDPGVLSQSDDVFQSGVDPGFKSGTVPLRHSIHIALEDTTFKVS